MSAGDTLLLILSLHCLTRSEIADCREEGTEDKNEVDNDKHEVKKMKISSYQIFMTGGAGYVLSKEAARRFAFGNSSMACRYLHPSKIVETIFMIISEMEMKEQRMLSCPDV